MMTEISLHAPNGAFPVAAQPQQQPEARQKRAHPNPDGRPVDENGVPVLYSQRAGPFRRATRVFKDTLIPSVPSQTPQP